MACILLVDDMAGIRTAIGTVLRQRGHEVLEASDGSDALSQVLSRSVDVVVTDIVMPSMDGASLIGELKSRKPDIKIVAMSGGGHGLDGQKMLDLAARQANVLLPKPFARDDLFAAIEQCCH